MLRTPATTPRASRRKEVRSGEQRDSPIGNPARINGELGYEYDARVTYAK